MLAAIGLILRPPACLYLVKMLYARALLTDGGKRNLKVSASTQSGHPQGSIGMEKPVYISIGSKYVLLKL